MLNWKALGSPKAFVPICGMVVIISAAVLFAIFYIRMNSGTSVAVPFEKSEENQQVSADINENKDSSTKLLLTTRSSVIATDGKHGSVNEPLGTQVPAELLTTAATTHTTSSVPTAVQQPPPHPIEPVKHE
ncbi:unnamed protein product [Caenorhabditis auriculariae]|uniref:Uncharacterized protein n=1 Tax=Caenorhabditis auriculariae TaxID=2777116 RepID=A0A8S1H280_9PELO|nr:unnamed protein product [Caenorhabditis auriculariae]